MPPVFDEKSYKTYTDEELPGSYPLKLIQVRVKIQLVMVMGVTLNNNLLLMMKLRESKNLLI